jgi:hypothetical protein
MCGTAEWVPRVPFFFGAGGMLILGSGGLGGEGMYIVARVGR